MVLSSSEIDHLAFSHLLHWKDKTTQLPRRKEIAEIGDNAWPAYFSFLNHCPNHRLYDTTCTHKLLWKDSNQNCCVFGRRGCREQGKYSVVNFLI